MYLKSLLCVLLLVGVASCFDSTTYTSSHKLDPFDYTVYWRVDMKENLIYLALRVKTTGWVGFGISEITSGSMPGSDIVTGNVIKGVGSITDRWSSTWDTPVADNCQDWVLLDSDESNGYTTLEIMRRINTTDPQDRNIVPGANRIIAAFGENGVDTFGYHVNNRVTGEITFYGVPVFNSTADSGEFTMDLTMAQYTVPNKQTQYACQAFAMPTDQDYFITQVDPIIDLPNIKHVHHFLAHVCTNSSISGTSLVQQYYGKPNACTTPLGQVAKGCVGIVSAWAAGGGSTFTPPEAGFPMGLKSTSIKFIILEVHYNNPDSVGGYVDNSGIKIHYTTKPRQYEADVLTLGDPFLQFDPIPGLRAATPYEAECPSNCTSYFPSDLTVFQSFPHMHQVGSKIWTTQWRQGGQINEFGRIEYWTFDHQLTQSVNIIIKPGDRLNTHCVYNTLGTNLTRFGTSSTQEMCMHFLSYYPRVMKNNLSYSFCGYRKGGSICGDASGFNTIPNPGNPDPAGGELTRFGLVAPCQNKLALPNQQSSAILQTVNMLFVSLTLVLTLFTL